MHKYLIVVQTFDQMEEPWRGFKNSLIITSSVQLFCIVWSEKNIQSVVNAQGDLDV